MVPGGRLTDQISLGVLASSVPREVVDQAIASCGRGAKRSDGKLPPHVMLYYAMALALFADDDYEEVLTRLAEPLARWGCWDAAWRVPGSSGITQARARLGFEPVKAVFEQVAEPVAGALTRGAWLAGRRLVSIDGFEWDVPDTAANAAQFGRRSGTKEAAFPKVRVVTLVESASRGVLAAAIGPAAGKGSGERTAAGTLFARLEPDMLLTADRGFYSFALWCQAAGTGADLLWRIGDTLDLPAVRTLADGSYLSVLFEARAGAGARTRILSAAKTGDDLQGEDAARLVRVIEYEVPDRGEKGDRELICLLTTITDPREAPAPDLAEGYHQRWEHESGNDEFKTVLRGPGRVLRSKSPDMVRQEIYGYLLTHYALSALICKAATEADIDPDRVKFTRTVRIVRRRIADPAAFSP
jgi:transposase IS4-like protein/DDE family transposase